MKAKYLLTCESKNISRVFASIYGAANTAFSLAVDHAYKNSYHIDVNRGVSDIQAQLRAGFDTTVGFNLLETQEGIWEEEVIVTISVITGQEAENLKIGRQTA